MEGTRKRTRHQNFGLRKACSCPRRRWAKCPHSWHINFKPRHGEGYRFSLDAYFGRHIGSKEEAKKEAENIRVAIRAGTFQLRTGQPPEPVTADEQTLKTVAALFLERFTPPKARDRAASARDAKARLGTVAAFKLTDEQTLCEKPIGAITEDDLEPLLRRCAHGGPPRPRTTTSTC
jgi:hypothetical protein